MPLPVAILCGGLATRLKSVAPDLPKSLVPVAGKPFIEHQLALLAAQGLTRVVLLVGHQGDRIRAALGSRVEYVDDGPTLLGTAGALRKALPHLGPAFYVLYGDSYLEMDYRAAASAFEQSKKPALMTVIRNEGRWDKSNVEMKGGRIAKYDKRNPTPEMTYTDHGLGILTPAALQGDEKDLADIYSSLAARGDLAAFEVTRRFYEIGSPEGLEETRRMMMHVRKYLDEAAQVVAKLDAASIEKLADLLAAVKSRAGRLFILGVGGSAGNASHAVNDFRKLCAIEAYTPTDNVSELTARVNDDGWETSFAGWLKVSKLSKNDMVLVFSVGGGDLARNVSPNLVRALELAKSCGAAIGGIVGRDGGYTAKVADACVIVPTIDAASVTAHAEAFQAVVWHGLVTHPKLQSAPMKWESTK